MSLIQTTTAFLQKLTENTTIVIFGLGTEGSSTYQLLRTHLPLAKIILTDDKEVTQLDETWQQVIATDHNLAFFPSTALVEKLSPDATLFLIKTPGIPRTHALFSHLETAHISFSLHSNTELFFAMLHELPDSEQPQTIGITGTKGKSTTTALIYHVLTTAKIPVYLAGNIGVPPVDVLLELEKVVDVELKAITVILELSSHQLRELSFSPNIAVVQNITPEHLDYYQNFEEYWQAKGNITRFQTPADFVIFNPDFELPSKITAASPAKKLLFSVSGAGENLVATVHDQAIYYQSEKILAVADLPLLGEHNLLNTLPAVIIGKQYGVSTELLQKALTSFRSLPHRLEFVAEKNGVAYYNDSQGTTPEAAIAAISSFPGKDIILLAGGSDKGVEFDELAKVITQNNVTQLLLFPPTGEKIAQAVQVLTVKTPTIIDVNSMSEAVALAYKAATPGSIVLLSPACASFGLFKNYQDRGNQFKAAVAALGMSK